MNKIIFIAISIFCSYSCSILPQKQANKEVTKTIKNEQTISSVVSSVVFGCSNKNDNGEYYVKELDLPNNHFDIPVVYNKDVQKWVNYFTRKGRVWTEKYLKNSTKMSQDFSDILAKNNLPKDLIFLSMAESGFQADIMSHAKAVGAWQFMPFTGKRYGLDVDYFFDERRHPEKSAQAAANYLADLYKLFNSWELAMAAYNAGEGKIARAIKRYKTNDFWKLTKFRYLKPETKNYVPKIMALAIIGKNLEYFGFNPLNVESEEIFVSIAVPEKTDLVKLSEILEVEYELLRSWNPEYVRWHTPLEKNDYSILIPNYLISKLENVDLRELEANDFQIIEGKKLDSVSRKYNIPLDLLKILNQEIVDNKVMLPYRIGHDPTDKMYLDLKSKNNFYYFLSDDFYKIKKGESLWSISKKLGVSFSKIKRLNPEWKKLKPGDKVAIKD